VDYKKFNITKVLVTGSDGQLGKSIKALKRKNLNLDFCFADSKILDITSRKNIELFFRNNSFDYIINCAAYTNVEQAEKETEKAHLVNAEGVKNLAESCKRNNIVLIHISTDYVFDGNTDSPYNEEDIPNPINEYGKSKLKGEIYIQETLKNHFIVRTSWLYSEHGKNFYKTILEKSNTQTNFTITTGETGTPTNANDLAKFLIGIIEGKSENYGTYHFSNLGNTTWFDFAKEILMNLGKLREIKLEKINKYPTFAQRPKYSVLDKNKTTTCFNSSVLGWKESLEKLMNK